MLLGGQPVDWVQEEGLERARFRLSKPDHRLEPKPVRWGGRDHGDFDHVGRIQRYGDPLAAIAKHAVVEAEKASIGKAKPVVNARLAVDGEPYELSADAEAGLEFAAQAGVVGRHPA